MDQSPSPEPSDDMPPEKSKKASPTQFFLRGLAISLPPVLTLVIVIWMARGVNDYIIHPISTVVRFTIAMGMEDAEPRDKFVTVDGLPELNFCQSNYVITPELRKTLSDLKSQKSKATGANALWTKSDVLAHRDQVYVPFGDEAVPYVDYVEVVQTVGLPSVPTTALGVYMELATKRYFKSSLMLSAVAVALTIVGLYFIGRIVTVRMGAWFVQQFERLVLGRLPVISNVYSSVKQVTDFFFTERPVTYNRVVALEYPRRGMWSIGFVTSDSMLEITIAAGEPLVSVLMPTSPMPMTGFTVSVPKSDVIDLNLTIDQAFQFCLSCGVLVPPQQHVSPERIREELARRLSESIEAGTTTFELERKLDAYNSDSRDSTPPPAPPTSAADDEAKPSEVDADNGGQSKDEPEKVDGSTIDDDKQDKE